MSISLTKLRGETEAIESSLETIEEDIDEYGAPSSIGSAVQRLREALDRLNESVDEEENS